MTAEQMIISQDKETQLLGAAILNQKNELFKVMYTSEDKNKYEENLMLDKVRWFQEHYPELILAGSAALFMVGVRLSRFAQTKIHDIDFIAPYWMYLKYKDEYKYEETNYASNNDFDNNISYSSKTDYFSIDLVINPKEKFKIAEYNGHKYKIADPLAVINAKLKYAWKTKKHRDDILEMINNDIYNEYLKDVTSSSNI